MEWGGGERHEKSYNWPKNPKNKCSIAKPKLNKFTHFCFVYEANGRMLKSS
jgi:hypothetical protein